MIIYPENTHTNIYVDSFLKFREANVLSLQNDLKVKAISLYKTGKKGNTLEKISYHGSFLIDEYFNLIKDSIFSDEIVKISIHKEKDIKIFINFDNPNAYTNENNKKIYILSDFKVQNAVKKLEKLKKEIRKDIKFAEHAPLPW